MLHRWLRFNAVGALGLAVQLGSLWMLVEFAQLQPMTAALIATELAVVHNFFWHARWTWGARRASMSESAERLLKFNLSNGAVSIVGNLVVVATLTACAHVPYLASSLVAIALCSAANFLLSERWVFVRRDLL